MINNELRVRLTSMGWGGRVVYNYDLMVKEVMSDLNITEDEAMEFIDSNVSKSQVDTCELFPPIIIYSIPKGGEKF